MSARGTRYLAKLHGGKYYVSTNPCKRGHLAKRITATGTCTECRKIKERERYHKDIEAARAKALRYSMKNRKLLAEKVKIARANETPEKRKKRLEIAKHKQREWRLNNPNHVGIKIAKRKYSLSPKGKATSSKNSAIRRTGIKQATPSWADLNAIGDVYMEAFYMQMQVDHIVPLKNPLVCGLHVWDNMQLLTPSENNRKGNRHWPDMPA